MAFLTEEDGRYMLNIMGGEGGGFLKFEIPLRTLIRLNAEASSYIWSDTQVRPLLNE